MLFGSNIYDINTFSRRYYNDDDDDDMMVLPFHSSDNVIGHYYSIIVEME